jgi:site-specific recombinase
MDELIEQLAAAQDAPLRHLWLRSVVDWLRATDAQVPQVLARFDQLLHRLKSDPALSQQVQALWQAIEEDLDLASVLAEFGFAGRGMFLAELGHRLMGKWLPVSPVTRDAADLFALVFHDPRDAAWIQALAPAQVQALGQLLEVPGPGPGTPAQADAPGAWPRMVSRALAHCIGQISACGFRSDLRQRMSLQARATGCFDQIPLQFQSVIEALAKGREQLADRVEDLRFSLVEAQWAGVTVYEHLDEHGVSVEVVYQLRQLRRRIERAHLLLDVLSSHYPARASVRLVAQLVRLDSERRSVRSLIAESTQMTAARVAERSAETGEHYITRDWPAYRHMLSSALGGGALVGLTTWIKFLITGAGLSLFWSGWWAGVNYALSFVLIQMLHLTLATKQPAVTAPAMVARLRTLEQPSSVFRFVDEVAHLIRSQMAAIAGNLAAVIPAVIVLHLVIELASGQAMLSQDKARYVLDASQLLGPSVLFAALTGVLLFASSIVAGWAENWFVLNRLDSALAYHPSLRSWLGVERAARVGAFFRRHISGLAANISLGFMLGLLPVVAQFFGLYLDVRHVTLLAGQLSAAAMAIGWSVLLEPSFWSAVVTTVLVGACNVLVSFYLAFRLAMKARGVPGVDRKRIRLAIGLRLRRSPGSFFWPPPGGASAERQGP